MATGLGTVYHTLLTHNTRALSLPPPEPLSNSIKSNKNTGPVYFYIGSHSTVAGSIGSITAFRLETIESEYMK